MNLNSFPVLQRISVEINGDIDKWFIYLKSQIKNFEPITDYRLNEVQSLA